MREDRIVRGIVMTDIDAHGNVVLWDHGPTEPGPMVDRDSDEYRRLESEAKAWHAKYGTSAVPITMDQGNARHAMAADPERYSLDPDVAESEVEAEIAKIRDQRESDRKVSADRAEAAQLVADRKTAIATVIANRRAAELEAKAPRPRPVSDDRAERDPLDPNSEVTV